MPFFKELTLNHCWVKPLKSTILVCFLFLFHLVSKNSYAGVTIEPFLGGEGGIWKSEESFPLSDYDVSGTQRGRSYGLYYGSRVYIDILKALFLGIGYYKTKNQWNISDDPSTSNDDSWRDVTAERKNLNFFFGLQKPGSKGPLYKIWFSFSPFETLTLNQAHQPSKGPITYNGSSLSGAYSRHLIGWFYLNLEFSVISMNKRTQSGSEYSIPSNANFQTYTSYTFNTFLVSISMPLNFFKKKVGW